MMKIKKILIAETVALVIIIGLIVSIFFVDFDLGIFKLVSKTTLMSQFTSIKDLDTKLVSTKTNYDASIKNVETAKSDFTKQKQQYDAITDDTISIIKEATTDEKYNIEYMWIKLGNYAKSDNLALSLVEPGGTGSSTSAPTTTTTTGSTTTSSTTTGGTAAGTAAGAAASTTPASSGNEFTIKVTGNYIDVSDFIFELENDNELRFKLDKINMEYAGSNQITATFAVKNLKFIK